MESENHQPLKQHHCNTEDRGGLLADEEGAATAEYAIVIMAAVALAGVLVAIMRSGEVQAMLLDLVQRAFAAAG